MPNGPLLLNKPPPTTKGQSSKNTILETLPNVGETVIFVAMLRMLSENYTDVVSLVFTNAHEVSWFVQTKYCVSLIYCFILPFRQVPLGTYPEERFDEPATEEIIKSCPSSVKQLQQEMHCLNSPTHIWILLLLRTVLLFNKVWGNKSASGNCIHFSTSVLHAGRCVALRMQVKFRDSGVLHVGTRGLYFGCIMMIGPVYSNIWTHCMLNRNLTD